MKNSGCFTIGTISFLAEQERADKKGSFVTLYVRYGTGKDDVDRYKVWSQNYEASEGGIALKTMTGEFVAVETGQAVTVYGDITFWGPDGDKKVSLVFAELASVVAVEVAKPKRVRKTKVEVTPDEAALQA